MIIFTIIPGAAMHVLVVENMPHSMLGLVGTALNEAGATLDIRKPILATLCPKDRTSTMPWWCSAESRARSTMRSFPICRTLQC